MDSVTDYRERTPSSVPPNSTDDPSAFELLAQLYRRRLVIAGTALAGAILALALQLAHKPTYTASASFTPEGNDTQRSSGARAIAGQLGINLDVGGGAPQPQFYADLVRSRAILEPLSRDSLAIAASGAKQSVVDLLGVPQAQPAKRQESAMALLKDMINTSASPRTSVVTVEVTHSSPAVALAVAAKVLDDVNQFNLHTRQSQASAERAFTEARLAEARRSLRDAEDRLQGFLQSNRAAQSPELAFDKDRLAREVALQQQIVTSLSASFEEARIREVRNLPVITTIETPWVPSVSNPRRRVQHALVGFAIGLVLALTGTMLFDLFERRRREGDIGASQLYDALQLRIRRAQRVRTNT